MLEEVPLVERERELDVLNSLFREAKQGRGLAVAISGEAGIGKSRLVREFARRHAGADVCFIEARCYRDVGALPYGPWTTVLKELAEIEVSPQVPNMQTFAPHIFRVLTSLSTSTEALQVQLPGSRYASLTSAEQDKMNFFHRITSSLVKASEGRMLILFFDDFMWADDASIELLAFVSRELHNKPILIFVAFRDAEIDAQTPLAKYLYQEARDKRLHEMRLKPVGEKAAGQMVEHIVGRAASSLDLFGLIYEKTGGNPFFIEELSRSVREQLLVPEYAGRPKIPDLQIPTTVKTLIQQRFLGLRPDTMQTLTMAAIIGREFTFELLRDITGLSDEVLLNQLEEALRGRILREHKTSKEGTFLTFLHALVHEYLLQEISLIRRRKCHGRIADLIQEKYPALASSQPDKLAFHYLRAGVNREALKYTLEAAESAERVYAHKDAKKLYEQALELIEDDPALVSRVNERLGDLLFLSGQYEEARSIYDMALAKVPTDDRIRQSRLHRNISHTLTRQHRYEEALEACNRAESALSPEPTEHTQEWRTEWVDIQIDRVMVRYWQGKVPEMVELVEKIRPTVEQYGTALQRGRFYQCLVSVVLRRDRYVGSEEAVSSAQAALSATQESGNLREIAWSRFWLGFARLWSGNFEQAQEQLAKSLIEAERSGDLGIQARCLNYLALLHRKRGSVEESRRYISDTLAVALTAQMPEYVGMARGNLAWIAWRERDLPRAEKEARAALELLRTVPQGEIFAWTAVWPLIGTALAEGRLGVAIENARIMLRPRQQPLPDALTAVLEEAIGTWEQNRPEITRAQLEHATQIAEQLGYL